MKEKFIFWQNFKEAADKLPDDLRLKFYDAMTDYAFNGVEPDDAVVKALIAAIKPSLDCEEKRGGSREGAGRPKSKLIKINQNEFFEKNENQNNSNVFKDNQIEIKNNQKNQFDFLINEENLNPLNLTENKAENQTSFENFDFLTENQDVKEKEEKKTSPLNPQEENNKNKIYISPLSEESAPLSIETSTDETDMIVDLEEVIAAKTPVKKTRFIPPDLEDVKKYCDGLEYPDVSEAFVNFYASKGWMVGKNPMKDWKAAVRGWVSRERTIAAAKSLLSKSGVKSESYDEGIPL